MAKKILEQSLQNSKKIIAFKKKKIQKKSGPMFMIHKHAATHLHYDLRIEINGILASWAMPKEPPILPKQKRLAIPVADHPYDYGFFEGIIPQGQYGGGTVMVWDIGTYRNVKQYYGKTMQECKDEGRIEIYLKGKKLRGLYALIKTEMLSNNNRKLWLFIKLKDSVERKQKVVNKNRSALTNRTMFEIAMQGSTEY